jgi:hypothetical protein
MQYNHLTINNVKKPFSFADFNLELQVLIRAGETALDKDKGYKLEAVMEGKTVNWERVYQLACIHQIRPLLLRGVSGLKNVAIPEEVMQQLKQDCILIAASNLRNTQEMLRLLTLYKENGITVVPYKGAYLANTYYGDFGLREFGDIDLFVNESDIFKIKDIMIKDGYKPVVEMTEMQEKWEIAIGNDYNFQKKGENGDVLFHVEPHYRSNPRCHNLDIRPEHFKGGLEIKDILGKKLLCLSDEANIVIVFTHHGIREEWSTLKSLFDFERLLNNNRLNWDEISKIVDKHNVSLSFLAGIQMCSKLFDMEINQTLNKRLNINNENHANSLLYKLENIKYKNSFLEKHISTLRYRLTFDRRLKTLYFHLLPAIYPSKSDFNFIKIPRKLFYMYFFIRPARLIIQTIRGKA